MVAAGEPPRPLQPPSHPPSCLALMSLPAVSTAPEDSLEAFLALPTVLEGCSRTRGRQKPPIVSRGGGRRRPRCTGRRQVVVSLAPLGPGSRAIDRLADLKQCVSKASDRRRPCHVRTCDRPHLGGGRGLEEVGMDGRAGCNRATCSGAGLQAGAQGESGLGGGQGLHGGRLRAAERGFAGEGDELIGGRVALEARATTCRPAMLGAPLAQRRRTGGQLLPIVVWWRVSHRRQHACAFPKGGNWEGRGGKGCRIESLPPGAATTPTAAPQLPAPLLTGLSLPISLRSVACSHSQVQEHFKHVWSMPCWHEKRARCLLPAPRPPRRLPLPRALLLPPLLPPPLQVAVEIQLQLGQGAAGA